MYTALSGIDAAFVSRFDFFDFVGPDADGDAVTRQVMCGSKEPGPLGYTDLPSELCADWLRRRDLLRDP